jgi:hypothetical protein
MLGGEALNGHGRGLPRAGKFGRMEAHLSFPFGRSGSLPARPFCFLGSARRREAAALQDFGEAARVNGERSAQFPSRTDEARRKVGVAFAHQPADGIAARPRVTLRPAEGFGVLPREFAA